MLRTSACDTKFSMEDKLQQSDTDNENHYAEQEKLLGCKVELLTLPTGSTGGMPRHTRAALPRIANFLTQSRQAGSPAPMHLQSGLKGGASSAGESSM